jgi:light-harvesting complex I chlorophyll a/b binding protein 1
VGNDDLLSMDKAAEYEVIHGRWAMLAIPGIVAQEQATGIPWYDTGALCTPTSCLENYTFPGAPASLAPEGSGLPSFWAVVAFQVVFVGLAEAYRGGLTKPPQGFPEPSLYPGGRFDPLKVSEKLDLQKLKLQELKHGRLAMGAFLGCIVQSQYTHDGPVANLAAHVSDPTHVFFGSQHSLLAR